VFGGAPSVTPNTPASSVQLTPSRPWPVIWFRFAKRPGCRGRRACSTRCPCRPR
jgi:hypothetical protein